MKLLVFVLQNVQKLDELMLHLSEAGIRGATIFETSGMAKVLTHSNEDDALIRYLRTIMGPDSDSNKTILFVANEEQVTVIRRVIREVIGDLFEPKTGILFSVPVDFTDGIDK
jgi:nitrogen regulatory protein P-II 1